MARSATAPEITLFRTAGQWSRIRAAVYTPSTVYSGRINQVFSTLDRILGFNYDGGSGTLANVLEGMTVYFGSTAGAWDKGIGRVRGIDASFLHIGETSDIRFADNDYFTIVDSFELWARPVFISSGVIYMDGGVAYSDQHTNYLPLIRGGSNRVVKKTGATVSLSFDFPATVPSSSVSSRSTSAPGSTGITGGTTQTPSVTWNSVGWKRVSHTVTAANGKSNFIVRYVYIWDDSSAPEPIELGYRRANVDSGGWEVELALYDQANLSEVRDHALIILFAEDHYGSTETQIGPVSGSENILFSGWIAGESIDWRSDGGSVSFKAYTGNYFLQKIPAWPDGVTFVTGTPANWTQIKNLTVDLGLIHHFLMWRSTAPRIMDIYGTDDSRYTKEVSSLASTLWDQMREMAFDQIYARALCNCLNQLYIEIHPQLTPLASRSWPTVMTLTEQDIEDENTITRRTMTEASIVDLSGVAINANGVATAYFSLSPGHSHSHYGGPSVQSRLLLSSQSQANQLAGLYRGWRNNFYEPIELRFAANNRLVDIAPRQKLALSISSGDTIRELAASLGLIPLSIEENFDPASGYSRQAVTFEAETFEDLSTIGDTPGSGDVSIPPLPGLPPLPPFDVLIPGAFPIGDGSEDGAPSRVVMHDTTYGLLYSENFNDAAPDWITINAGLTQAQYQSINKILISPTGEIYVAHRRRTGFGTSPFIAYAPSIGATFTILEDITTIPAKLTGVTPDFIAVNSIGMNPITGQVLYTITVASNSGGKNSKAYLGSGLSFSQTGLDLSSVINTSSTGTISFAFDQWRYSTTLNNVDPRFIVLNAAGASIVRNVLISETNGNEFHVPISTSDSVYRRRSGGLSKITANGAVAGDFTSSVGSGLQNTDYWDNLTAVDPTGFFIMADWDPSGRRGRSSDEGATFSGMPTLPVGGPYAYAYAGGVGLASRWIAAKANLRYTEDFGTLWTSKLSNSLLAVAPIMNIDIVKAIGFGS